MPQDDLILKPLLCIGAERRKKRELLCPKVRVNIPKVWTSRPPGDDRGSEMVPTALCSKWRVCFFGLCPHQVFAGIKPPHLGYHCMLTCPDVTVHGFLYLSHGKIVFQVDKIWCKMSHDSLILSIQWPLIAMPWKSFAFFAVYPRFVAVLNGS